MASKTNHYQANEAASERARAWLLGALAALAVAGVLLSADSVKATRGAGLPLVALTLLLAVGYCGLVLARRIEAVPFGFVEWGVVALVALHGVAMAVALSHAPRPAINMFWQWIGLGAGFLLARQLIRTAGECRALVAVMLALGVLQSLYGGWQLGVQLPADRAKYEQAKREDPNAPIPGLGNVDAATRADYEARLYSSEPLGTFSLTNSLAGWLAAWLVVGVGVAVSAARGRLAPARVLAPLAIGLLLMAACLYQTHSRTAQLAAAGGCVLLVATGGGVAVSRRGGWLLLGSAVVALAVIGTVMAARWSALAGARLSVVYRLEYWQATLRMIRDHWIVGCGPGQFGNNYTRYMLPQARETIADPHNFLLEVAATAGIAAATALVVVLIGFFVRSMRKCGAPEVLSAPPEVTSIGPRAVALGAGTGLLLAYCLGRFFSPVVLSDYDERAIVVGLLAGGGLMWCLWPWIVGGKLSAVLMTIGAAVMLINLLGAGGIGFPGVAGSLWLLMALGLCLAQGSNPARVISRPAAAVAFLVMLGLAAACQFTALSPVVRSRMAHDMAEESFELAADKRKSDDERQQYNSTGMNWLHEAVQGDPYDELALRELAQRVYLAWLESPTPDREASFRAAYKNWMQVDDQSAAAHKLAGDWFLKAYRQPNIQDEEIRGEMIESAVDSYRTAVERYPASSLNYAHLAWAEHLAGEPEAAAAAAAEALRLDQLNPHADRKLNSSKVRISGDPQVKDTPPADLMRQLLVGTE